LEYDEADSEGNGNNLARIKDPLECEEVASPSEGQEEEQTDSNLDESARKLRENFDSSQRTNPSRRISLEREHLEHRESRDDLEEDSEISANRYDDRRASSLPLKIDQERHELEALVSLCEEDRGIEDAQGFGSIWITDRDERGEMSRRPQILKVVDNDVTRRRHRRSVVEIDAIVEDVPEDKRLPEITKEASGRVDTGVVIISADTKQEKPIRSRDHEKDIKVGIGVRFGIDKGLASNYSSLQRAHS